MLVLVPQKRRHPEIARRDHWRTNARLAYSGDGSSEIYLTVLILWIFTSQLPLFGTAVYRTGFRNVSLITTDTSSVTCWFFPASLGATANAMKSRSDLRIASPGGRIVIGIMFL